MKALVLYTEAAPYVLASLRALAQKGVEVTLVRWPVNAEAPFRIEADAGIADHLRTGLSDAELLRLADELRPDLVLASGWVDKGYLAVCRRQRARGVPTVMTFDTAWRGHARQWANVLLARAWMPRTFSHAWVTGGPQRTYARKLGFPEGRIRDGFYTADTARFEALGRQLLAERDTHWPHRFLCVARYIPAKGHRLLCDAFAALADAGQAGDWELWCAGTGELFDTVRASATGQHPRIRHLGFKQAEEMPAVVAQCGAFVLPSLYEPWGVVVHEHACAGLPLVLSSAVGAAERFLVEGRNGFRCTAGDPGGLHDALRAVVRRSDDELRAMGHRSARLGHAWNPQAWADTALSFIPSP
ncbi:MAG: glycosyltransferase family 4 protein [Flavobacteriales bacterium]|jgi:glycosyltransferase involved in cell wall biosynthesis|nr:glycosyltransferase family 4 protein [Flavobacteriales bacterium]